MVGTPPARNAGLPHRRRRLAWLGLVAAAAIAAPAHADWTWSRAQGVPEARTEVSVATDGSLIYLLGGFGENRSAPTSIFAYDPAADAWSTIGDLVEGVNHAGLVVLDGRLYLVGGFRGATFEPTAALRILDLATGEWRDGAPLPTPRGALAAAVLGGRIHALGGVAEGRSVATHEIYDPATDRWQAAAPMAVPRNHLAAAVVDGRLYAFGGRDERTMQLTATEVYDPESDAWRGRAPMPTGRSGIAAAAVGGLAAVFGGETRDRTFNEAEAYDPSNDRWTALPPMPTARHGLGAAAVGERLFVLSGGPEPGFSYSDANEVLSLE